MCTPAVAELYFEQPKRSRTATYDAAETSLDNKASDAVGGEEHKG